jgi:frataxin-like iron-binding protein CyaY
MTERVYMEIVTNTLQGLCGTLDEIEHSMVEDIDYADGVLTIEMWNGETYVLNKQAPNK